MTTLSPIQISGPAPEGAMQMAHVWPSDDPVPVVGQERELVFSDGSIMAIVSEVMSLGEGYTGVVLSRKE